MNAVLHFILYIFPFFISFCGFGIAAGALRINLRNVATVLFVVSGACLAASVMLALALLLDPITFYIHMGVL